ncbi:DUF3951 domain-containing protein [Virgibacillus sp. W0181]|uniref:DUF3951 domain-containing protein n=1 Tax=Virgibacillus sp. W0181 TaxID=3391581 RepID=UPI003F46524A
MAGIIFSLLIILVVILIIYKFFSGKGSSDNSYIPYDHITGQSSLKFKEGDKQEDD